MPNLWRKRRDDNRPTEPSIQDSAQELIQVATEYEKLRQSGRLSRALDPVDLLRIRALALELDVERGGERD